WRTWFLACALGIFTLGPPLLSLGRDALRELLRPSERVRTWIVLTVLVATVVLAFLQDSQIVVFVIFPALLLAAFRLNFIGVTFAAFLTVAIALTLTLTLTGFGPFAP